MDSLSQALLGASVAGAVAPSGHRRKALLIGAALGTLPDLDVLIDYGDAVRNFTYHRGFSHSLFVLTPFSLLLWFVFRRLWPPANDAPLRWLAAIGLALITHPLLDAHTAYGTQLFWPMATPPISWATLFIIDPMLTLPLLVGTVMVVAWPRRNRGIVALRTGIAISAAYIAWSWVAQGIVTHHARGSLAASDIRPDAMFITPTPFNTLLWRIVVRTDDGFLEGFDSLLVDEANVQFIAVESDNASLREASDVWAVARLRWFSRDFVQAQVADQRLILSDLRMGQHPQYVFNHAVARRGNPHWQAIPTEELPVSYDRRLLANTWRRIWTNPATSE